MTSRGRHLIGTLGSLALLVGCASAVGTPAPACDDTDSDPSTRTSWSRDVAPLLWKNQNGADACTSCHAAAFPEGSTPAYLFLESYDSLRRGSKNGRVVVPGKPCASLLVDKLRGTTPNGARMPRGGPYFTAEQIRIVSDWIAEGAERGDEWSSTEDAGTDAGASPYPGY